ncbi:unnamed protein product [Caenorhabditis nigoni]
MYQNNKLGYIRYFMLAYQIACFIADVHVNFLMQVVPLYPIFGGFIVGVLAEWFDMSLHFAMMTIVFIVIVQLELLNICFERKHQAIANTLNTHVLPVWFRIFAYSLCVACPISCCVWFHTVRLPKDDQWDLIKRDWPQYISSFQNLNHFDVYAKTWWFILLLLIACFLTDVHLTLLMQPVPLYPMFGGFIVGVLAEWFDMSVHFSMMGVVFIVIIQLELLNICFERKHQAIANTLRTHILPVWFRMPCYFACVACPLGCSIWFHTVRLSKDEQWDLIKRDWPQYISKFQNLTHFDVYEKTWWFVLLLIITVLGGLFLIFLFVVFILDILRMMVALKLKISASRFQKHKEAIQSLLVQFATSSFCLAPPCCLAVIILLELEQAQLLTELCILWFATHSSANTVSLLIFFPPYRNFILKQLRMNKVMLIGGKSSNVVQPSVSIRQPERSVLSVVDIS